MHSNILTPARAIVLRNASILTGIFFGIQICSCDVTQSTFYKQENTLLTAVYDQIRAVTEIVCCSQCHSDSSCNSVSYNLRTKECLLSNTSLTESDSATTDNSEWVTFSIRKPSCKNYLVSGPNGVNDSQLTESDYRCTHYDCTEYSGPADGNSAKYARLNLTGLYTAGWWLYSPKPDDYIQVDFLNVWTISAIALQGSPIKGFVTSFKVLTSKDCVSFNTITDGMGNDKLFEGNSNKNDIVIRDILVYVRARCVRIKPVDWDPWMVLRFDVLGC